MLRSFAATAVVALLFGGQALIGLAVTGQQTALTVLLFTSLAVAVAVQVLADPLAGVLDRLAFSRSPDLRPTAPRCGAPRRRCRCARPTRSTASTTTPSSGSPAARSVTTGTCPSSSPAR